MLQLPIPTLPRRNPARQAGQQPAPRPAEEAVPKAGPVPVPKAGPVLQGGGEALLPNVGRQLILEALAGALADEEGAGAAGLQVVVKNTFIDVEGPQEERYDVHSGGIQTCTARLSSENPQMFFEGVPPPPPPRQDESATSSSNGIVPPRQDGSTSPGGNAAVRSEETLPEVDFPSSVTVLPEGATLLSEAMAAQSLPPQASRASGSKGSAASPTSLLGGSVDGEDSGRSGNLRYVVKNTFIEFEGEEGDSNASRSVVSCTARLSGTERPCSLFPSKEEVEAERRWAPIPEAPAATSSASSAPSGQPRNSSPPCDAPMYPAPQVATRENTLPPPPRYAASAPNAGRQVLLEALAGVPLDGDGVSEGLQLVVKNTFLDFEEGRRDDDRGAQTCTARFGPTPASFPTPTSMGSASRGTAAFGAAAPLLATHPEEPAVQEQAPPSQGSALHGQLGEDGQPACQPCAWFYKESGCLNGLNCRYCHLCPQGELKQRKKQKIARLRGAEAEAAAAAAAAAAEEGVAIDGATAPAPAPAPAVVTVVTSTAPVAQRRVGESLVMVPAAAPIQSQQIPRPFPQPIVGGTRMAAGTVPRR